MLLFTRNSNRFMNPDPYLHKNVSVISCKAFFKLVAIFRWEVEHVVNTSLATKEHLQCDECIAQTQLSSNYLIE